jgi:hypothetical protein
VAELSLLLVPKSVGVRLGRLETVAFGEGELLFAGAVVDANCASVRHKIKEIITT